MGRGKASVPAAATRKALATQQKATAHLQMHVRQLEGMAARNAKDKVIASQVLCCATPPTTQHVTMHFCLSKQLDEPCKPFNG